MRLKKIFVAVAVSLTLISFSSCDILEVEDSVVEAVSGTLNGWDYGSGYEIKFCYQTENNDELFVYGSSPIESDGSFSIEELAVPPNQAMERVGRGPVNDDGCTGNVEVNDANIKIGFGKFKITESGSNKEIGSAYLANAEMFSEIPAQGNYIIEFVYCESEVILFGVDDCSYDSDFIETVQVDIYAPEGWNKITNETVYMDNNEAVRNFVNGSPEDARWFFKMHNDNPDDTEYPFHINGQFDNWNYGGNMSLQFGMQDYMNNEFKIFAEANISTDGSFSFDHAYSPPNHLLIPVQYGPGAPGDCEINLNASNPYVLGGSGYFVIMNKQTNELFSNAGPGYKQPGNGSSQVGDYDVVFIFANDDVEVTGSVNCVEQVEGHIESHNSVIDLNLVKGWNLAKSVMTVKHDDYNTENQITGIQSLPNNVVWYYNYNPQGN